MTICAKILPMTKRNRRVVAIAYDGLCTFEFGVVVEMFGLPRPELGVPWYEFEVCSLEHGPIRATGGIRIQAKRGLRTLATAGTIVVPGWRDPNEAPPATLLRAVRRHNQSARHQVRDLGSVIEP